MASKIASVGVAVQHGQCPYKMMKNIPTDT